MMYYHDICHYLIDSFLTCNPGSAVVEALQLGRGTDNVARGKDVDLGSHALAIITTTVINLIIHWRHCNKVSTVSDSRDSLDGFVGS